MNPPRDGAASWTIGVDPPIARRRRLPTAVLVSTALSAGLIASIGLIALLGIGLPTWELRREFDRLAIEEVVTRVPDELEPVWANTLDPMQSSAYLERSYTFAGDCRELIRITEGHLRSRGYRIESSAWDGADVTDDAFIPEVGRDPNAIWHSTQAFAPSGDEVSLTVYPTEDGVTSLNVRLSSDHEIL